MCGALCSPRSLCSLPFESAYSSNSTAQVADDEAGEHPASSASRTAALKRHPPKWDYSFHLMLGMP